MLHHPSVPDTSRLSYSGSIRRQAHWLTLKKRYPSALPQLIHIAVWPGSQITLHVSWELGSLIISDFCSPSSVFYFQSYFTSWSVLYLFLLPERRSSYIFLKYSQEMLFDSPILQIAGLPTHVTLSSNPDLAFNQDNVSIHLQRNRSERKRLQGLQRTLRPIWLLARRVHSRKSLMSGSSTKLTKVAARFSSIHEYSSSFLVSWTTNSVTIW